MDREELRRELMLEITQFAQLSAFGATATARGDAQAVARWHSDQVESAAKLKALLEQI